MVKTMQAIAEAAAAMEAAVVDVAVVAVAVVAAVADKDRIGLGWRAELAASILIHLDQIDVVEILMEHYLMDAPKSWRALRTLAAQAPIQCHGVSLGLASAAPVDVKRLDRFAKMLNYLQPDSWSEHLAFVRAGKIEIGHLAAPPRTMETVEGCLLNLQKAKRVIGSLPSMENIATLIDAPCSTMSEPVWVSTILKESGAGLLLDLSNLYTNAVNFGHNPLEFLEAFPLDRVRQVHLAGGRWIEEPSEYANISRPHRLLDDHLHDVPEIIYQLLERVGERAPFPLTVILERDGNYPAFNNLLSQLERARTALALGRKKQFSNQGHRDGCNKAGCTT